MRREVALTGLSFLRFRCLRGLLTRFVRPFCMLLFVTLPNSLEQALLPKPKIALLAPRAIVRVHHVVEEVAKTLRPDLPILIEHGRKILQGARHGAVLEFGGTAPRMDVPIAASCGPRTCIAVLLASCRSLVLDVVHCCICRRAAASRCSAVRGSNRRRTKSSTLATMSGALPGSRLGRSGNSISSSPIRFVRPSSQPIGGGSSPGSTNG